ncbi:RlmE family RNA methyltransferase [Rickettsiales bacterium LUAb2]
MKNKITGVLTRNTKTVTLKKNRKRKASSTKWLARQLNDVYVNSAKEEGYYARSAYKLIEINQKFNLLKKGYNVIDLGAAPGGWSQVASKLVSGEDFNNKNNIDKTSKNIKTESKIEALNSNSSPLDIKEKTEDTSTENSKQTKKTVGLVIAVDLLDTKPLPNNVIAIKGDFLDQEIINSIINTLGGKKANVILSDMAPNTSGNTDLDHLRIINLIEIAFYFALQTLELNGSFVAKVFQGGLESNLLKEVKSYFKEVKHFKPLSSRKESKEIYLVAKGFKGYNKPIENT